MEEIHQAANRFPTDRQEAMAHALPSAGVPLAQQMAGRVWMAKTNPMPPKIDRRLVGDPIQIDGYSLQPVARVRGRYGAGGSKEGGGAGGQFSVEPVEVIVRAADGTQSTLALADPSAQALRSMAGVAATVAALAVAFNIVGRLLRRRRSA
jgi:hypothetical protein